jgi:hypothetical protein
VNPSEQRNAPEPQDAISELLAGAESETRERVTAIWQRQSERLRAIAEESREEVARALGLQLSEVAGSVRARIAQERLNIVTALMQALGECFTRMRRYESDWQWCEALLDAAATVSRRAAFFSIRGRSLCFQGARGLPPQNYAAPVEVPVDSAPSFFQVMESSEPVEAPPDASHVTKQIATLFGEPGERRALLMPVVIAQSTVGILYTEGAVDNGAVEAIAAFAGATLEKHLRVEYPSQPGLRTGGEAEDLDPATLACRRFARVETARLLLEHADEVRRGRESNDLYHVLKKEIESVRQRYRERFPGAIDHFHSELVRTLANDDPAVLGAQYPGPLS